MSQAQRLAVQNLIKISQPVKYKTTNCIQVDAQITVILIIPLAKCLIGMVILRLADALNDLDENLSMML